MTDLLGAVLGWLVPAVTVFVASRLGFVHRQDERTKQHANNHDGEN